MGRHGTPRSRGGGARGLLVALLGIGLLAAGGITAKALIGGDDGGDSVQAATSSTTGDTASDTEGSGSDSEDSPSQSASADGESADVPQEFGACMAEVAAGEKLAAAAADSARDWKIHYMAQIKLDRGEYTADQTKADWAKSKARGDDDLRNFSRAKNDYADAKGGCDQLDGASVDASLQDAAEACVNRAAALDKVGTTGGTVNDTWHEHLNQMENKDSMDGSAYMDLWYDLVERGPKEMARYDDAVSALKKAPACEQPA